MSPSRLRFLLLLSPVAAAGCGDAEVPFARDDIYRTSLGISAEISEEIDSTLESLFGTPYSPRLPKEIDFLDLEKLQQATGPVISHTPGVTQGLYTRHCARCHGLSGDGRGPAAYYQEPYPRDFRRGVYKWKSTRRDCPPTVADLDAVLEHGVPGTAMPSFALLPEEEREILRDYVIYLSIRGQLERELIAQPEGERSAAARDLLPPIIEAWAGAEGAVVELDIPEQSAGSIERGKELFHSRRAACSKCHGEAGRGVDEQDVVYDLWNQDRVGKEDGLPLRVSRAPRLAGRTARGGATRDVLFLRIHQGVAGTPMLPAGPPRPGEHAVLTDEEIADLTDYLTTLLAQESAL